MLEAMFCVAVLASVTIGAVAPGISSATCLALSAASSAVSSVAAAAPAVVSATVPLVASGTSFTVVAGTGAGVGVTGDGVFQGSSTGFEAFQAATPAATAAAITPKTSQPRFLGFCG